MKNKIFSGLIVFAITLMTIVSATTLIIPVSAQAIDEPWPMWRHDPAHIGVADSAGPKYLSDPPKWMFKTDAQVDASPAIAYGNIYVGSWDQNIYCLSAQTGSLVWKYKTNYPVISSLTVTGGRVYTGAEDGNIYCLDATTGAVIWKTSLGELIDAYISWDSFQVRSSPCVVDGRLYVGHVDYNVYCLDITDGSIIWTFETGGMVASSPAVVGGAVYIGAKDSFLYKLNATDGTPIWKFDTTLNKSTPDYVINEVPRPGLEASPLVVGDTVYLFANWGWFLALQDSDVEPTVKWKKFIVRLRGNYGITQSTPVISWAYQDGKVFFVNENFLECDNAETGEIIWPELAVSSYTSIPDVGGWSGPGASGGWAEPKDLNQGYLNFISWSSPCIAGNQIYIGSDSCSVYSFDVNTGMKNSWYETGGQVPSSPAVAYGNLYIGSNDWSVYCFSEGKPRDLGWPPKGRSQSTLTATLSSAVDEIMVGDWVAIEGTLDPTSIQHGRTMVVVRFRNPDGWDLDANGMSNPDDGSYRITYHPDMDGTWTATAFWYGDTFFEGAEAPEITFTVTAPSPPPSPPAPPAALPLPYIYAIYAAVAIVIIAVAYLFLKRR
jgi:outer membrane protein assembly factor BamB